MKAISVIPATMVLALLAGAASLASAEDWTTTDGKFYKNVKVMKVEDDAVTILDTDGGALVPLASLSPELQDKFHYDPKKAQVAAAARAKADSENPVALEAERVEAAKLKAARDAKYKADKQAVPNAKAAAAAAEPKDDPLHASNFDVNKSDDSRVHYHTGDALSTNDPHLPIAPAPSGQ